MTTLRGDMRTTTLIDVFMENPLVRTVAPKVAMSGVDLGSAPKRGIANPFLCKEPFHVE
jgi:hypothetical protein